MVEINSAMQVIPVLDQPALSKAPAMPLLHQTNICINIRHSQSMGADIKKMSHIYTFFALEDMRGLKIGEVDGEVVLRLDKSDYSTYSTMDKMLRTWLAKAKKLESGEITKEEYDEWRYKYPELDTHQIWAKVPSQEISDMLIAGLKEMEKEEKKEEKRKKKK